MAVIEQRSVADFPHRLLWFASRAEEVLDDVLAGGVHVAGLPAEATAEAVTAFLRLASRMQAVAASLLPHAETVDVAADATPVATSTGAWWTCTAEGCEISAAWCHAHHVVPWAEGGKTTVTDGRLVCPRHHTLIHQPRYHAEYLTNGKIRLTKRRRQ
jgi:hypothetical protein